LEQREGPCLAIGGTEVFTVRTQPFALDDPEVRVAARRAMRLLHAHDHRCTGRTNVPQRTPLAQAATAKAHRREHKVDEGTQPETRPLILSGVVPARAAG